MGQERKERKRKVTFNKPEVTFYEIGSSPNELKSSPKELEPAPNEVERSPIDDLSAATVNRLLSDISKALADYRVHLKKQLPKLPDGFRLTNESSYRDRENVIRKQQISEKDAATVKLIQKINNIYGDEQEGKAFLKDLEVQKNFIKIIFVPLPNKKSTNARHTEKGLNVYFTPEKGIIDTIRKWFNEVYLSIRGTKGSRVGKAIRKQIADAIKEERKNIKESLKEDAKAITKDKSSNSEIKLTQAPSSFELPMMRHESHDDNMGINKDLLHEKIDKAIMLHRKFNKNLDLSKPQVINSIKKDTMQRYALEDDRHKNGKLTFSEQEISEIGAVVDQKLRELSLQTHTTLQQGDLTSDKTNNNSVAEPKDESLPDTPKMGM